MIDYFDEIVKIEELNNAEMIDIEVSGDHFFYANNILTKNSHGLPATSDFMGILGLDEDAMVYKNEIWYKIVKNRLGGRVGETNKFYHDARSLKTYDSTELDKWIDEKDISGDDRDLFEKPQNQQNNRRRN